MLSAPATEARLAALLSVSSIALWFFLGFPWEHHNESLVWAIELDKISFWDALRSNPITPVQTWRPLGVALAWLGFHLTQGGIWPQQLLNFALTAAAWLLALRATPNRLGFAWLSFICGAGFFSGYIYLFHLHGVFYGPLFMFLAYLLVRERREPVLTWPVALGLLAVATVVALFHTFALLFVAAYIGGCWLENRRRGRPASLPAAVVAILLAAVATKLLVSRSTDLGQGSAMLGLLSSYRALELKPLLSLLSLLLAVLAAVAAPGSSRQRLVRGGGALMLAALLGALEVPVILAWIAVCALRSLFSGRLALAALIAVTALLPVATGTGSPTYALFVLMPCILATIGGVELSAFATTGLRRGAFIAIAATFAMLLALKLDVSVPIVDPLVQPLRAEGEKTRQLQQMIAWLDQHPEVTGGLSLGMPGDFPVNSNNAIERNFRAPTHAWPFGQYLKARYGARLSQAEPQLRLCFGGETVQGGEALHAIPGIWAGTATLERLGTP